MNSSVANAAAIPELRSVTELAIWLAMTCVPYRPPVMTFTMSNTLSTRTRIVVVTTPIVGAI